MNKNKSGWIIGLVIVVVLIALFMLPRWSDPTRAIAKAWNDAGIDCLPSHTNANQHIHPEIKILVDGKPELISANIGIVRSCMAEVHTHEADGIIHVESVSAGKTFTLSQFFAAWGKSLERDGFKLAMTVDGAPTEELGNLVLKDKHKIVLNYAP